MKYSSIYKETISCSSPSEVFDYLMDNLIESITYWDYFVGWNKIENNLKPFEIDLNTLNYLVGKKNVEAEFRTLLEQQPSVARLIPLLLACRNSDFTILIDYTNNNFQFEKFNFNFRDTLTIEEINRVVLFIRETKLLEIFETGKIRSVPDYVFGVEVGLDSNTRKNRSGKKMETIIKELVTKICTDKNYPVIEQATPAKIKEQFGIELKVDKASRNFDFAVKRDNLLYLLETNYYGGGGSKLKATAGEYKQLHTFLANQNHKFIWLTDGVGWQTSRQSLAEAFNHIDHTLNLRMITIGLLEAIIENKL